MAPAEAIKHVYDDIIKSAEDKRLYRGLELINGMKILLISDFVTDKSSAAVSVHIGCMSDPEELPGLAHFCEHMLFLGTDKYPAEDEYSKFLSEHGGSSNAYTADEQTCFYFDVSPTNLDGALDRFAQFFHAPLFTEGATEREVNAVNSENDKNLSSDFWRLAQLNRALCDPTHDFAKFGTGNKETLLTKPKEKGIDVRAELLKFHNQYYSSNIMCLCVLGKESLDELQAMVVPLFADVVNKNVTIPEWKQHPMGPEQLKIQAHIVPVQDIRSLKITWPLPDLHEHYKTAPAAYLSHLIGHEGKGSLLSELKNKEWVNVLSAGNYRGAKGFSFFKISVDLTEEGIKNIEDIVGIIFQYLLMLRQVRPQKWIFDECLEIDTMFFRFKNKSRPISYTETVVQKIHEYPMKEVLFGGFTAYEYKPELIDMVLNELSPDKVQVAVVGKEFEGKTDLVEKWYGTKYSIMQISEDSLKNWRNVSLNPKMHLPGKNEFIATDFNLTKRDETQYEFPKIIHTNDLIRLWYKQDTTFLLPKACVGVKLLSAYTYVDPLAWNLSNMFISMLEDELTESTYAACLADLSYEVGLGKSAISIDVDGYHDKLHLLLKLVIDKMLTLTINGKRFEILKENYIREIRNFKAAQPNSHASHYMTTLLTDQRWTKEELLETASDMTVDVLQKFIPHLFSKLFVEMFVYGNVTKQRAREMADIVEHSLMKHINPKPLPESQRRVFRDVALPDGCSYSYTRTNEVHPSSAIKMFYQCDLQNTANNMVIELFTKIIDEPCFNILRTQQQLGYSVSVVVSRGRIDQGLSVLVQSEKDLHFVETRIEAFLLKMKTHIEEMDNETYEKHVEALATEVLEKPKNLFSQNDKYLQEIDLQRYNFDRDNVEVAFLRTITKDDILKFYKEYIDHNSPRRRKLTVYVVSSQKSLSHDDKSTSKDVSSLSHDANGKTCDTTTTSHDVTKAKGANKQEKMETVQLDDVPVIKEAIPIEDVDLFKRGLRLLPLPKPFTPIETHMAE